MFYNPNVAYKTKICYLYTRVIDQAFSAGSMLVGYFKAWTKLHSKMAKKLKQPNVGLSNSSFSQSAKAIPLLFRTKYQMESNHYEMKPHFQTSSFSLDVREFKNHDEVHDDNVSWLLKDWNEVVSYRGKKES